MGLGMGLGVGLLSRNLTPPQVHVPPKARSCIRKAPRKKTTNLDLGSRSMTQVRGKLRKRKPGTCSEQRRWQGDS